MATFDLAQDDWTELVGLGEDTCQMLTMMEGVALVSVGDPAGDSFQLLMDSAGHRQNAFGPRVPIYARADTPSAKVSLAAVANEPAFLAADQAIVEDGEEFAATGGTVTLSVADGVVTAEFTPDP